LSGTGGLVGGLGGLFGIAILAAASIALINMVGNMYKCSVCGYQNPSKKVVVNHMQTIHPEDVARHAQSMQQRRPAQPMRRTNRRTPDWVW